MSNNELDFIRFIKCDFPLYIVKVSKLIVYVKYSVYTLDLSKRVIIITAN